MSDYGKAQYLICAEYRDNPVLNPGDVEPDKWSEANCSFAGEARPGEFYPLQLVVYAAGAEIDDVSVTLASLHSPDGGVIAAESMNCFHTDGVDYSGEPMRRRVAVVQGEVQSLWIGVQVALDAAAGIYEGVWAVEVDGEERQVHISLRVNGEPLHDFGDGELWRHSRLRWLNSSIATDNSVTKPYTSVTISGRTAGCLGRTLTFGCDGLPEAIVSMFNRAVDGFVVEGRDILASPIALTVETTDGPIVWTGSGATLSERTDSLVAWKAASAGDGLVMTVQAMLEYDGYVDYRISVKAERPVDIRDIRLEIPFRADVARYLMGMGRKGGYMPETLAWQWDPDKQQDALWIGDIYAGLRCRLKDRHYVKPFVNIYYRHRPLKMPDGWYNGGKGGALVAKENDAVVFRAYCGERTMSPGDELHFDFDLMVTPLKPIDLEGHWNNRYYQVMPEYSEMGELRKKALEGGANIINLHHGIDVNPYINYPFFETEALAAFVNETHSSGIRAKLYYTLRELTDRVVELKALRSFGEEFFPKPNGSVESVLWQGDAVEWVRKRLGDNVIPAWKQAIVKGKYAGEIDSAVITDGTSRLVNYYIEGLRWLIEQADIDGIYIDDVAYDRLTIRRVRKVLDRMKEDCLIDFHTWNHMNDMAGFGNNMIVYTELFPYLDSLWIGECYQYDEESPDYWLTEVSGIPFGMMGEMLEGGGNPWRGMIYGMSNRMGWMGEGPEQMWKFWDRFGIQNAQMLGYWHPDNPVRTGRDDVLATVYRHQNDKLLIAIASWCSETVECALEVDWAALGWHAANVRVGAPEISGLQAERTELSLGAVRLEPLKGMLIVANRM